MEKTQTDLLEQAKDNAVKEVRVSMPAEVISFNASTKTVSVSIGLKMVGSNDETLDYPPLVDCPCVFSRGGGFHLVHPYKAGDKGVVLFSDRCFDGWFESGQVAPPLDFRIHSMSDAYFIGGVDCLTDVSSVIPNAMFIGKDDNSAGLQINADGSVVLKGASFEIQPPTTSNGISNNGTATSTGNISTTANILINGKPVDGHTHGGVQTGSGNTGAF